MFDLIFSLGWRLILIAYYVDQKLFLSNGLKTISSDVNILQIKTSYHQLKNEGFILLEGCVYDYKLTCQF